MIKIFLLLLVITSVGFVAYNQGTKHAPLQNSEQTETTGARDDTLASTTTELNQETPDTEPDVSTKLVMDLSSKALTQTPSSVFKMIETQKLDLSHNNLTGSLQAEIRHLQNLKVLDLSHNQFTGVPAEIGQLKNLEVLDLSHNHITGLPLELGNLSNLKMLDLRGNEYSKTDLNLIKEKLPASTVIETD
jgi:Leucine-rich repeat (LRR) protein